MKTNHILAILALAGAITAAFTRHAEHNGLYPDWKFRTERDQGEKTRYISASHLSDLLYHKTQEILIFDVRDRDSYESYHIPRARKFDEGMGSKDIVSPGMIIVYDKAEDSKLGQLSDELSGRVFVLKGGMEAWYSQVLFPDFSRLRVRNREQLEHILQRSRFFGGTPQNTQVLNIESRETSYREGC